MEKAIATAALRRRHGHLRAMADRGTSHEKQIALEKLRRLEEQYYFSEVEGVESDALFAGWGRPRRSNFAHPVLVVSKDWMDAANLVKWVFGEKFQTASSWRSLSAGAELMLEAQIEDVNRFQGFAKQLLETIIAACQEFFGGRPTRELDRAPFLNGVYDGLVNELRPAGTMMPGYSPLAKKKATRGRKTKPSDPGQSAASVHPYDFGREVGRKMNANIPRDQLCESIRIALAGPLVA